MQIGGTRFSASRGTHVHVLSLAIGRDYSIYNVVVSGSAVLRTTSLLPFHLNQPIYTSRISEERVNSLAQEHDTQAHTGVDIKTLGS